MAQPATTQREDTWHRPRALVHFPGLPLSAKDVAIAMWNEAGGQPGTVATTTARLADAVGISDRRVRDQLAVLAEVGLVEVLDRQQGGLVKLYISDPDEVKRARLRRDNPQSELPFGGEDQPAAGPTPPATVAADFVRKPPRPTMDHRRGVSQLPSSHRNHRTMEPWNHGEQGHREEDLSTMGEAVAESLQAVLEYTDPMEQKRRLIEEIGRVVNDSRMDRSIPGRVADLVVNGQVDLARLRHILTDVQETRRAGGFKVSAGAFFLFKVRGLSGWTEPGGGQS